MHTSSCRKIKVNLPDYDFPHDLKNRVLLSKLNSLEAKILQEIVCNSLSFPISELIELVEATRDDVHEALETLACFNLFKVENNSIIVDKDARKYFEVQIERFQEDFKPDLEFFQNLLTQVPIHIIPIWYSLPKSSDNIFESIIDRHLTTPKTYEKFLYDLQLDDDIAVHIVEDLYNSPDYTLDVKEMELKYSLSREAMEEIIITLEFNKVCCLSYIHEGNRWRQVLTPFEEWRNYLLFLRTTQPIPITDTEAVQRKHPHDFGFVEDIDILLRHIIKNGSVSLSSFLEDLTSTPDGLIGGNPVNPFCSDYRKRLVEKMRILRLTENENNTLKVTENAEIWLSKPIQEKAMALYFSTINLFRRKDSSDAFSDRDIREVEKSLKRILNGTWVYVDDFITGMNASIGSSDEVTLQRKGRRWTYVNPEYTEKERNFIRDVLFHHLFESGMVQVGVHPNGKLCFSVTNFGKLSLGD